MKKFFGLLLKVYAVLAAYAVALLALIAGVLFWSGAVTTEKATAAFQVLRSRPAPPEPAPEKKTAGGEREEILERKAEELRKLDERVGLRLAQIRAEQEALDRKRSEAAGVLAEAQKTRQEAAQTKSDAELAANVPILSRMDGAGIVSLMSGWDDARFVRYLRALRPGKAAEVLETMRTDPQFEDEFRRVPADAPPGTKTRAERLSDEFKKAP